MKRKNIVGLIALVAVVALVVFVGCIEEKITTSSFEIEYPVTASFTHDIGNIQITLYKDGSGFFETPTENFYGHWEVKERTTSKIKYRFEFKEPSGGTGSAYFALYSNHDAIWDPGWDNTPGNWR